jgi:Rrf2 family protein
MSTYAIRAVVSLAHLPPDHPFVSGDELARAQGIEGPFLRSLLQRLVPAGVLLSRKGREGGFRLARPAASITVLDVVEAVEGPIRGQVPGLADGRSREMEVRLGVICEGIADDIRRALRQVTIADLASEV